MRVAIDCDDAGLELKRILIEHLRSIGVDVEDLNLLGSRHVDYPDIGFSLARRVAQKEFDRGVLICGTGLGMCMIANKVPGVYAGVCHDVYSAQRLRKSNDAQIITMGARVIGSEAARTILSAWVQSEFEGGRSSPKVTRMRELEREAAMDLDEFTAGRMFIGTSWKMNKTVRESVQYAERLTAFLDCGGVPEEIKIFVIPPYTAIQALKQASGGRFWVGAQNMHWEDWGAATGEISAPMLEELEVDLVELGHAERRRYFNESDETVRCKLSSAFRHGIRALVCVGEQRNEREYGIENEVVTRQLKVALSGAAPEHAEHLMVAYEPVWAIGEGAQAASANDIRVMNSHIRSILREIFRPPAARIPVLYGGTVDLEHCVELLIDGHSDGLFVGRAAWSVEGLIGIISRCAAAAVAAPSFRHAHA